jgi:hypothetical protein
LLKQEQIRALLCEKRKLMLITADEIAKCKNKNVMSQWFSKEKNSCAKKV